MFARRVDGNLRAGFVALTSGILLAGCGASTTSITSLARVSPTPATTPTPTPAPTPSPTSSVPITKLLTKCPAPRTFSSLHVFSKVTGAGSIGVAPDGSVWVTTGTHGVIAHLSSGGAAMASYNEPSPQGVVVLPSGNVLFADQADDRIEQLDPATLAVSTFLQLTPIAGVPGLDGLGEDAANSLLIVPDTEQGQVLSVPLSGGPPTPLATGVPHPIGVAVGPGGAIEVATGGTSGLLAVPASGGPAKPYQGLSQLSAVAVKGLLIYVTAPAKHEIIAFNPATGHTAALVTGIGNPQGLALLTDGRLVVADASTGTLAALASC